MIDMDDAETAWKRRLPCWVEGTLGVFYATEVIAGATTTILRGARPYSREDGMMEVETWEARTDICRPMPRSSFGKGEAVWYPSNGNLHRGHVSKVNVQGGKTWVLIDPCNFAEHKYLARPESVILEEDIMSKLTGIEERELRGSQRLFWEKKLPCWVDSPVGKFFATEISDSGKLWGACAVAKQMGADARDCRLMARSSVHIGDHVLLALDGRDRQPVVYEGWVTKIDEYVHAGSYAVQPHRVIRHPDMRTQATDSTPIVANAGLPFPRWLRTTCFGAPWAFFATEGNEASVRGIDLSGRRVTVPTDTCGPPTTTPRVGDKVYIYRPETDTVVWGAAESEVDGALLVHIGMGEPIQRRPVHEVLCAVSAQRAEIDPPRVAPLRVLHTGMRVRVRGCPLGPDVQEGVIEDLVVAVTGTAGDMWNVRCNDAVFGAMSDHIEVLDDGPLIPDDLKTKPLVAIPEIPSMRHFNPLAGDDQPPSLLCAHPGCTVPHPNACAGSKTAEGWKCGEHYDRFTDPMTTSTDEQRGYVAELAGFKRTPTNGELLTRLREMRDVFDGRSDLGQALAVHFGLSSDAPDRVVFDTAKKAWDQESDRVKQLEAQVKNLQGMYQKACLRASRASDANGILRERLVRRSRENTELLAENARLRRGK